METGWIKTHRKMIDWQWYTDVPCNVLFSHLKLIANFEKKKWRGIEINRGDVLSSRESLAENTGLTVQQVRSALIKLKSTNDITIKSTNKYTLISITNYDFYQGDNQEDNQQITNNQPTNNQQITTTKEYKKEKKDKNEIIIKEKNTKKENFKDHEVLPSWLPLSEWREYLSMREFIKKPISPQATKNIIIKLDKFRNAGYDPAVILRESIINHWTGVFLQKEFTNGKPIKKINGFEAIQERLNIGASEGKGAGQPTSPVHPA